MTFNGRVKCIYIDPPYNTGNKDFVYNDHFVAKEDLWRHSTWCEFMFQRLTLAKELLTEDGVMFLSIDDNEMPSLRLMMNQIFGESSHIATCVWQKRYSRENGEAIGDVHEYILVYAVDAERFKKIRNRIPLDEDQAKVYRNPDNPKETDPTKRWRGLLELTKDVMASPHLPVDDLFKAHIIKSAVSIPEYKVRNAIIKRKHELYPMGDHPYVQNLYALCLETPTSPLLGIRILQYLSDAQAEDGRERSFVAVDVIYEYLTSLGIQNKVTTHYLEALLLSGLIFEYDPTVTEVEAASRIEISPSGITHLNWSITDEDYIKAMRDVTPVRDKQVHDKLKQCLQDGYGQTWKKSISTFIDYLIAEDDLWCQVPVHRIYDGQRRLGQKLSALRTKILSH